MLWNNNSGGLYELNTGKAFSTYTKTEMVDQDQIVGFAYLKEKVASKNSHDLKNTDTRIIVVGKKYVYKINSLETERILQALQSDLDPKYWRIRPYGSSDNHFGLNLLHTSKFQKKTKGARFYGKIYLYYEKNNLTDYDRYKLGRLEFGQARSNNEDFGFYRNSFSLYGDIVGLSPEIKNMKFQNFSQNYEIALYADGEVKYILHPKVLLAKVALTPITLAGDLVAVPLYFLFNIGR